VHQNAEKLIILILIAIARRRKAKENKNKNLDLVNHAMPLMQINYQILVRDIIYTTLIFTWYKPA
jgi:hypothetical protein